MNRKQKISLGAAIVGLALILYALYGMQRASDAKGWINRIQSFFTEEAGNPVVEFFGGEARQEASKYDSILLIMFISGIVLTVGGPAAFYYFRKRRNR